MRHSILSWVLCVLGALFVAAPGAAATPADRAALNLLLFELRLDNDTLADSLTTYEAGGDVLMPLGELAHMLTLGITVDPREKSASGFVLREDRVFRVDMASETVTLAGGRAGFDPALVRWIDDDIYVASRLLRAWLPLDFEINYNSLTVNVVPREKLPLQFRLEREHAARGLGRRGGERADPGYPLLDRDYRLLSVPFVDQTLGMDYRGGNGRGDANWAYSAFVTADVLGMEGSMYVSANKADATPDVRLTLARNDPDAALLGPLRARSLALGNVAVPALANVLRGSGSGDGFAVSNRPLNQPSSYGLQTLRGDLPPGWDVTLYFNDALIGFAQSRADGLYEFPDQPLVFGTNEFRLVFNGPLGQTRVETQVFILDRTLTRPGEFFYNVARQQDDDGGTRQSLQFDLGLADALAATGGMVTMPLRAGEAERSFSNMGLRTSVLGMLLSVDYVNADKGGSLYELGVKTRLGRFSADLTRTGLRGDFASDFFPEAGDPVKTRDRLRLVGSVPLDDKLRLPVALDLRREESLAGIESWDAQGRVSLNLMGTSITHSLNWTARAGEESSFGTLQLSRRIAGVGVSGQVAYLIEPSSKVASYALSASRNLADATRVSVGVLHVPAQQTTYTAGLTRNFGSFGLGVSGRWSDDGEYGVGVQLFMAIGREPYSGRWVRDWQPMAGLGGVSARAFLDANMNGVFDADEQALDGAGFIINGGARHPARTDAGGLAYLNRLAPKQYADVAIDTATLEDPQWLPARPGVRVLPRPGRVQQVDFPVVVTGEVDGTVYLVDGERSRGIGNAVVELVDGNGLVAASGRSASDGYYVIAAVRPGRYRARIAAAQLERLGLASAEEKTVEMGADGDFVNGLDLILRR